LARYCFEIEKERQKKKKKLNCGRTITRNSKAIDRGKKIGADKNWRKKKEEEKKK
jgi:hypothetical protein